MSIRKQGTGSAMNPAEGGRAGHAGHCAVERLEHRRLFSRLIGISGNLTNPTPNTTDEVLYEINYTSNPGTLALTRIIELSFVPDGDSIAYNPANGLLYRASGAESYRDNPDRIGYHDNHFMQTIDMRPGANLAQAGVFNANPQGERDTVNGQVIQTGPYGLPAPFPSWILPAHRRLDTETDSSFRTPPNGQGPGEYHGARDFVYNSDDGMFYVASEDGIFRLAPDGSTSELVGFPFGGSGGPKGITFATTGGERRMLVTERDGPNIFNVSTFDGTSFGFVTVTNASGTPIPGILSLVQEPDGTLLGIAKSVADPGNARARELVRIDLDFNAGTAVATSLGTFTLGGTGIHIADLAIIPDVPGDLTGTRVFYNNSALDENTAGASPLDDNAIDFSKTGFSAGAPTAANISGYSKGLNGVMVELFGVPTSTTSLLASDFTVRSTSPAAPNTWAAGPAPSSVSFRRGAGVGLSDRVTLIWNDNASVKNGYLEVTVAANARTGLSSPARFVVGSLIGDTNGSRTVDVADLGTLATNYNQQTEAGPAAGDFNVDGVVDVADLGALATNYGRTLPATPPPAIVGSLRSAGFTRTATPSSGFRPASAVALTRGASLDERKDRRSADLLA